MKYESENLKQICSSYIAAKFDGTYVLESKFGKVKFSFPSEVAELEISFKRISGNGKILINNDLFVVSSKIIEVKRIQINSNDIFISRPEDCLGEVAILSISVQFQDEEYMSAHWKKIVKNFTKHKGLSLIKDELFASSGATIEPAEIISNIVTDPPNVYSSSDNKLTFNYNCKIIEISLAEESRSVDFSVKHSLFANREKPTPIAEEVVPNQPVKPFENININNKSINHIQKDDLIKILYDSDPIRGLNQANFKFINKSLKFINSNNKHYVVLKPNGVVSFPITGIEPDKDYIVIVSGKKINGNGRIRVSLSSSLSEGNSSSAILNNIAGNIEISINSKKIENNLKLNLGMLSDGSGEVLISRVLLIEDLNNLKKLSYNEILSNNFKINYSYKESKIKNISIRDLTRDSAIFNFKNINNYFNIKCSLNPLFYEARQYVLSLARYIKDISIVQNIDLIKNSSPSIEETLTIGKLGRLQPSRRLYIEEWGNKIFPSKEDLNVIKLSDNILTPSNYNYVCLKYFFPEKNIILTKKPRIHVKNTKIIKNNYFIYFEKNINITNKIIKNWSHNYPKLYIVGTNLNCPSYIDKISEYSDYEEIYHLISSAEGLLDFNVSNQYNSSWASLARDLGCKIITNNLQNHHLNDFCINSLVYEDDIELDFEQIMKATKLNYCSNFMIENQELEFKNFLIG